MALREIRTLRAFDRMTALDFIGFYDPVTRLKSMRIIGDFGWRVCATKPYAVDDRGLRIEARSTRSAGRAAAPSGTVVRTFLSRRAHRCTVALATWIAE